MQVLVSSIDYNDYVGRIGIGRIERGTVRVNQEVIVCDYHDPASPHKEKIVALYEFDGLGKNPIQEAGAGEIVAFSGISDITIGRTLCAPENGRAAAVRQDLRPDDRNDLLRQRFPVRGPRGQIRHVPQPA